jgi:hypothetical protein
MLPGISLGRFSMASFWVIAEVPAEATMIIRQFTVNDNSSG